MRGNRLFSLLTIALLSVFLFSCGSKKVTTEIHYKDIKYPKHEFRGAWLSTAWQSRYRSMNQTQMKEYFIKTLDQLKAAGINAVIFQVRPQADAFFRSDYEPWSAWMTGVQGKAPEGHFDALAFLVTECHKRNMELHAWLNPYRVTVKADEKLAPNHLYFREPERFVQYGDKIYFDPGIPANRKFICAIVSDIVTRYQVDAIHMDDYFYPYPIAGENFPDDDSFATYASQQGFGPNQRADWRRYNVNCLIREVRVSMAQIKPWVRFGISPFGIYRNKANTPDGSGSNTNGLQNYDNLYADVKLWVQKGWIDYNMPQLYWEIGHTAADYKTLIEWWSANNFQRPLYIGQDVKRTMDAVSPAGNSQLGEKIMLTRTTPNVQGNCLWPAYEVTANYKGIASELSSNYFKYPALIPPYTHMHNKAPKKVSKIKEEYTKTNHILSWTSNANMFNPETALYYVIYRFPKGVKEDLDNAQYIVGTTRETRYVLPYEGGNREYKYVITAADSFHNESKGQSKKVSL